MINHVRTLLLNSSGTGSPGPDFPGEEYVPADFRAVTLTEPLTAIRRALFGGAPDRVMLNFRLRQFMGVLHATELETHVFAFDPRVTYWPRGVAMGASFGTQVTAAVPGQSRSLYLSGDLLPDEAQGLLRHQWRVTVESGSTVLVERLLPPARGATRYEYTVTANLSNAVPLTGSSLLCYFEDVPGSAWEVEAIARPQWSLASIVSTSLQSLAPQVRSLFGAAEPYRTFRNLWQSDDRFAYRLGAILLAVAYRTEELRQKESG